jgi:hypothetical protein
VGRDGLAGVGLVERSVQLGVQSRSLLVVEIVPVVGDLDRDHGPLGQIRGLVEHQATVTDIGMKRFHTIIVALTGLRSQRVVSRLERPKWNRCMPARLDTQPIATTVANDKVVEEYGTNATHLRG